ncbi:MAG: GUN4 domain-containing protein [Synechococcus sp.]
MDYGKLRDLLSAGKWKDADQETLRVMVAVAKREKEGWLDRRSSDGFPCEDLRTIDQLWVNYSEGRFGFSVQKKIWEKVGGSPEADYDVWGRFGDQTKWRVGGTWLGYSQISWTISAPYGHLPIARPWDEVVFLDSWHHVFSRAKTCHL